jgi:hypothetical protein
MEFDWVPRIEIQGGSSVMRRPLLIAAIALGIFAPGSVNRAHAQFAGTGDPFSLYYSYYLPRQAALAAQTTPLDTINAVTAVRQQAAVTDRSGLYDPVSPYAADEDADPFSSGGGRNTRERLGRPTRFSQTTSASAMRGQGPPGWFNRTGNGMMQNYYPTRKMGQGPNRNLAVHRKPSGGMGAPGMSMSAGPR